jgi:hypothetical protein
MGGRPSCASFSKLSAGRIPTKPAARGIVPVATAVVWIITVVCGVDLMREGGRSLDTRKPMRADWRDILYSLVRATVMTK